MRKVILLLFVMISLSAWGCAEREEQSDPAVENDSFAQTVGASAVSTEEGCYLFVGISSMENYLQYYDAATKQLVPLCGRADCTHDTWECNAFFDGVGPDTLCSDGNNIYVESLDAQYYENGERVIFGAPSMFRLDADGSSREKLFEFDGNQYGQIAECVKVGDTFYAIFYRNVLEKDGYRMQFGLYELDIFGKEEPELLFDGNEEGWTPSLFRSLYYYKGSLYFNAARFNDQRTEYVIRQYEISSGECKPLCAIEAQDTMEISFVVRDDSLYYSTYGRPNQNVTRVDLETGEEEEFLSEHGELSYDDSYFYITRYEDDDFYAARDIVIYDLEGSFIKTLALPPYERSEEAERYRGVSLTKNFILCRQREDVDGKNIFSIFLLDKGQLKNGGEEWDYHEIVRELGR